MLLIKKGSVKLKNFNTVNFSLTVIKSPIDGLYHSLPSYDTNNIFPRPLSHMQLQPSDGRMNSPGPLGAPRFLARS